jgi:tripartite-type tricarboxylate transporter receptor subunit TctC
MKTIAAGLALLGCSLFTHVQAQSWPSRPVTIVVSGGAGSGVDRIGRLVADRLSKATGHSFIVDNQAGAGGLIAPRSVARAKPDGYTLLFAGLDTMITNPYTVKDLGYDPDKDFDLVSMIYKEGGLAIAVHPAVPARSLADLFALAKKEPGKISYGVLSINFLVLFGQWLNKLAGTDMVAVPYKAPAQQLTDVLDGRIQAIIASKPTIEAHVAAGKLRVLAIDGSERFPPWPDVPLISETFPGFRLSGTGILVAPRGTSPEVVRTANRAMDKIVNESSYKEALQQMGFTVDGAGTPESIRAFIRDRAEYWQLVFKGLNVKPE